MDEYVSNELEKQNKKERLTNQGKTKQMRHKEEPQPNDERAKNKQ